MRIYLLPLALMKSIYLIYTLEWDLVKMIFIFRMGSMLAPLQLGYRTPLGSEAAVHSARQFVASLSQDQVILKLDFKNAFNRVRHDKVLQSARQHIPEVFPYVYSCYSTPSTLRFIHSCLSLAEGVQQGDPLDPYSFALLFIL